jgi:hypothetical protein
VESSGDGCGSFHKVSVGIDDEHVGGVCGTTLFIDEFEGLTCVVEAFWICTAPSALFQDEDKRIIILQDWMVDGSLFNAT